MSNPNIPESHPTAESGESFGEMFSQYERSHSRKRTEPGKGIEGTVIAVSGESVLLDIGFKTEGLLPLAAFEGTGVTVKPGDKLPVTIRGRDPDGYYELSCGKVEQPKD